ncbi:MAG TPA: helix-turn-helix domain-containing protein [Candidatus Eisenbergiella stercoravium]|nr:helix-turn-helix domain-containing protein [Candidatus Eisenbergiella stercoravium]
MINVLLADDDILTLNRLMGLTDWNAHGYEIIGQAHGGNECLKLLLEYQPEILILDIDMPDKNGVEITREIYEKQFSVKIVILSNYDTFDFVRDAMRYGAYDYLLKHQLTEAVLLAKLQELSEIIEKEGIRNLHLSFFTTVAKRRYLKGLIQSGITNSEEHAHMLTQKDFACGSYCISLMQITNFILITHFSPDKNRKKLIDSIITLGDNIFSSMDNGLITYMEFGQFVILFHYDNQISSQKIMDQTLKAMNLFAANVNKLFELTCMYQISDIFTEIERLPIIYQKTKQLLEQKPFPLKKEAKETNECLNLEEERNLMDALAAFNVSETEKILEGIFQNHSSNFSQRVVDQLLQIGIRFQQNHKVELSEDGIKEIQKGNMARMKTQDIYQFLMDYFKKIIECVPEYKASQYSLHIRKAVNYIRENYSQDLSLSLMAEYLHISPTHLSRLFRKETGFSFIDYLVNYRIECARQLIINTDLDLKTIAEQVGFHGYNYFLRTYKEKTGHTPSCEKKQ